MDNLSNQTVMNCFNSPHLAEKLTLKQWSQFLFILQHNDLLARFYYLALKSNCFDSFPSKVKHHLTSAKIKADRQAQQALFEAIELNKQLAEIDIKPIFLKGVAYTISNNSAAAGRTYSDMDILVPKERLNDIERKLSFFGWFAHKTDDYDQKYYREWAHEIPPMQQASRGTVADIHHNLLPIISGRAPNIKLFIEQQNITQDNLITLTKPAMVLHSIIHLFFNEEFSHGYRDITDLDLLFSKELKNKTFWMQLLELAKKTNFSTELFYATRYCQHITNSEFPANFLKEIKKLAPPTLKLALADFIFKRVLVPNHPKYTVKYHSLAVFFAFSRAHLLKMPIHILLYHTLHKVLLNSLKLIKGSKDPSKTSIRDKVK